ncbi:hypothetical protein [Alicyclobacillus macrosporangiidus]|uniref:Uncharacterized protein n=1 Tax=Alicyclobacillus macrosporangiidus TaxID=392015 RepID=A0A1I7GIY2_9BACL|nr:hypothetical protein [Alicyclobacillus macrosporangiidus]SFU48405.1 hypothetical protein SAMN05421543_102235 [Alicyclobacillus macrosporangiidus]
MQIELTREQYRHLLVLMFLGEWLVNGTQMDESRRRAIQETADYIYAMASQFGAEDWVEFCDECGVHHANQAMEDALFPIIDEYDEETFWDVLSHHLAYRDVMTQAGPDQEFTKEMEMKLWRRKEQYEQEFQKHGLDHVRLVFHGGKRK